MATALTMVTEAPARAIGLGTYGLRPGARADLVVLDLRGPAGPEHVLSRQPAGISCCAAASPRSRPPDCG
ncbi:MAG TPA: amidohydrolase family protein [bacterium]|nr:amidohydrolase family protein [bacterium]